MNESVIKTMMKFEKSGNDGSLVGYVHRTAEGKFKGVRGNENVPKCVCVLQRNISPLVIEGLLYHVTLEHMTKKHAYLVTKAELKQFPAEVHTYYVPRCVYRVECSFGGKKIVFDPLDGRFESVKNLDKAVESLDNRFDFEDHDYTVKLFASACKDLRDMFERDGFVKTNQK